MATDIVLVNMPYSAIERPSCSLGILNAGLGAAGYASKVIYGNLQFADLIGLPAYYWISNGGDYTSLLGEWTFADMLAEKATNNNKTYFNNYIKNTYTESIYNMLMPSEDIFETMLLLRKKAKNLIENLSDEIISLQPLIVGCTSTFQQNCGSLALLKAIKKRYPNAVTVMGGANCETTMGAAICRAFPWVDYVFSGEADLLFQEFVGLIYKFGRDIPPDLLPNEIIGQGQIPENPLLSNSRAVVKPLDVIPVPDYQDYFEQLNKLSYAKNISIGLPVEASRGCWWAERHGCTFCGLNGDSQAYRIKSPDRLAEEFRTLSKYFPQDKSIKLELCDNSINVRQIKKTLSQIDDHNRLSIFCETRILSNKDLYELNEAGITWIQVGIESFHDSLLEKLNKGSTALQNIQVLRVAHELGMRLTYNVLYNIPGEEDICYQEMSELIPFVTHLEPPRNLVPIRFDRFSKYQQQPSQYGLDLHFHSAYSYIYDLPDELLEDIAYFFEDKNKANEHSKAGEKRPGFETFKERWLEWRHLYWTAEPGRERASLYVFDNKDGCIVYDTRPCAIQRVTVLDHLSKIILSYGSSAIKISDLGDMIMNIPGLNIKAKAIEKTLVSLINYKFIWVSGDDLISLPSRTPPKATLQTIDFPGGFYYPAMDRLTVLSMPRTPTS